MFSRRFWRDLIERVVATTAAGGLAVLVPAALVGHVNWTLVGLGAITGGAVSLLKGLAASTTGNKDSASFTV